MLLLVAAPATAQLTLPLTLADARTRAVALVPDVVIQRDQVRIALAAEQRAEAAFDPLLRIDSRLRSRTDPLNTLFSGAPDGALGPRTNSLLAAASWSKLFESGAVVTGYASTSTERTNNLFALLSPAYQSAVGVDVRQPLAQGRRTNAPRLRVALARLETTRTRAQLARTLHDLVAAVEHAYWTLAAARGAVAVQARAVALAEGQRVDVEARIAGGVAAEADLATSDAAIAARRTAWLAAEEQATRAELALKALIAGDADAGVWSLRLDLLDAPAPPPIHADVGALVTEALERRPELDEVEAAGERATLDETLAQDRVRPQVDLVAGYAVRGLAGRPNPDIRLPFPGGTVVVPDDLQGAWGQALGNAATHRFADASVGLLVTLPLGNRAARADAAAAGLARTQLDAQQRALRVRIAHDVHRAVAALEAARARRVAAADARDAAARQLRAEEDRDAGGVSSAFLLLTRQSDLVQAELTEVTAEADAARAATELDRAAGRLLHTRGIEVGQEDR